MNQATMKLEFMFDGLPVGVFMEPEYPTGNGRYRYMPYRGPGHLRMQTTLDTAGEAPCYYEVGIDRVCFTVVGATSGALDLTGFERAPS